LQNSAESQRAKGKTPERRVMAVILRDKHNTFFRVGDGVFGLTKLKEAHIPNET